MDNYEEYAAARRLDQMQARQMAGHPRIAVNDGQVYLVPYGYDVMGYTEDGQVIMATACEVRTIKPIGRVRGGSTDA